MRNSYQTLKFFKNQVCNCLQVFSFVDLPGPKSKMTETKARWDPHFLYYDMILGGLKLDPQHQSVGDPYFWQAQRPRNFSFLKGYLSSFAGDLPTKLEVQVPAYDHDTYNII